MGFGRRMGDLSQHPATVVATLVIALAGAAVGIASYLHTSDVESELRAIDVEAAATTNRSAISATAGLILTVSIANESLRSIIVPGASLWLGDQRLGDATGYSAPEPGAERLPLPVTLDAREGRSVRLFVGRDPLLLGDCFYRWPEQVSWPPDRRKCRLWRAALIPKGSRQPLRLHLQLAPGGDHEYPVRLQSPSGPRETGWLAALGGGPQGNVRMSLSHDGTGPAAAIVHLDLWRVGDHRFHRSFERPLLPGTRAYTGFKAEHDSLFSLPPLEPGRYHYAFRVEGRTVWTGCFISYHPYSCPRGR